MILGLVVHLVVVIRPLKKIMVITMMKVCMPSNLREGLRVVVLKVGRGADVGNVGETINALNVPNLQQN